jgi:hypothetical protein
VSSSLFTITNLPISSFSDTEEDVFFFVYNNFEDLLINMEDSAFLYVTELLDRTGSRLESTSITFYMAIIILCGALLAINTTI